MADLRVVSTAFKAAFHLATNGPLTLQDLGDALRISERSARRYVYALQEAGVAVTARPLRNGTKGYLISERAWLDTLRLNS